MKTNSTIFEIINSVVVTNYPNDSLFAIVSNNNVTVVGDYHANNKLYKFDYINGTIKTVDFDSDIAKVDTVKFINAIKCEWYQREYSNIDDIANSLHDTTTEEIIQYCAANNIDTNEYVNKYDTLVKRILFIDKVCNVYDMLYNASETVIMIVDVLYNGAIDIDYCATYVSNIETELNNINEKQIDKDNNTIDIKSLKSVVSDFTKAAWIANDSDGIEEYVYNANSTLIIHMLGQSRKLSNSNGHYKWQCASIERTMRYIVFAMLARLYDMKHTDEKKNSK